MSEDRITTIINELHYWKKNKMLPAVYCDYLLALYTNGEEISEGIEKKEQQQANYIRSLFSIVQLILLVLLLPIALIINYNSLIPSHIQLGVLLIFILFSYGQYRRLKNTQNLFYHLSFAIFLLLIFLTSIYLSNTYIDNEWITKGFLFINFLFWFMIGRKKNIKYLPVASIFGILLMALFFVL